MPVPELKLEDPGKEKRKGAKEEMDAGNGNPGKWRGRMKEAVCLFDMLTVHLTANISRGTRLVDCMGFLFR